VAYIIKIPGGGNSLPNEYTFHPMQVHIGLGVVLSIFGTKRVAGVRVVVGEGVAGEVDVAEGVVALHEEVHVDVGVVVEGLVALQAWVSG
jgi:hypothetical protein